MESPACAALAVVLRARGWVVCVVSLAQIMHGRFRSAYLGCCVFAGHERQGPMRAQGQAAVQCACPARVTDTVSMQRTYHVSVIRLSGTSQAREACDVVRRSITQCCALDHANEPAVLQAWLANKTPENLAAWMLAPGAMSWGALRSGELVGFALLTGDSLALCYVVPEVLHQGVGHALLTAAEVGARQAGLEAVSLESTRTAEAFYRRNGYRPDGAVQRWAGLQAQPMRKRL